MRMEAREAARREEQEILAADWVADTQLQQQLSQLSYLDDEAEDQPGPDLQQPEAAFSKAPSSVLSDWQSDWPSDDPQEAGAQAEPGSQHQPLEISSDSNHDSAGEPPADAPPV